VWFLVRESFDQSGYRRAGPLAQGAQGTRGIACDERIRVPQCPPQRRLDPFCIGCEVDQDIDGAAPDGDPILPKHVRQHRNGRRTDTAEDLKSFQMQVFIATVEEMSQQRQRAPRPLDQGGFGGCPDLWVVGHHEFCPLSRQGEVPGKIRVPYGPAHGPWTWERRHPCRRDHWPRRPCRQGCRRSQVPGKIRIRRKPLLHGRSGGGRYACARAQQE
jgi:hypothetical protein